MGRALQSALIPAASSAPRNETARQRNNVDKPHRFSRQIGARAMRPAESCRPSDLLGVCGNCRNERHTRAVVGQRLNVRIYTRLAIRAYNGGFLRSAQPQKRFVPFRTKRFYDRKFSAYLRTHRLTAHRLYGTHARCKLSPQIRVPASWRRPPHPAVLPRKHKSRRTSDDVFRDTAEFFGMRSVLFGV